MNTAVTVRCVVCGLEVVGVKMPDGTIRPHNRARPAFDAPVEKGYCMTHAKRSPEAET